MTTALRARSNAVEATTETLPSLTELATEINAAHLRCEAALKEGMKEALVAGVKPRVEIFPIDCPHYRGSASDLIWSLNACRTSPGVLPSEADRRRTA